MAFLRRLFINERAATAIEYSLLTSLIAVSAVTAMAGLGDSLSVSLNILSNKAVATKAAR
ncbi:Flp family type IVb pilin [Novosphingobium sp.]|uniref:Flp family type IVb pilin n=1 Tax=Novosphingobium sp. TaxID=1874826 RepID=UPI0038BC0FA7